MWRHGRAHRFFSHARWSAEDLGLVLAKLIVALLMPDGEPVLVAIDDTLFQRTGRKVLILSFRVSRACDLRCLAEDGVFGETAAALSCLFSAGLIVTGLKP